LEINPQFHDCFQGLSVSGGQPFLYFQILILVILAFYMIDFLIIIVIEYPDFKAPLIPTLP